MNLLSPVRVGAFPLRNRMVMAPMARARSDQDRVPTPLMEAYYSQRATVGLIVTEASSVSPLSQSRPGAAAIFRERQVEGWHKIARAVHARGGIIVQQLYHLGRKSDPSRMPDGAVPVAPSAIAAQGEVAGRDGPIPFATPRALAAGEIPGIVEEFRRAAQNAQTAGMDGVEIHGANAYLIDQFLRDGTNRRTDRYGGPVENRARLLIEVVTAAIGVFGADRVGVRISPHQRGDGIADSDPAAMFGYVAAALDRLGIAYLHLIEASVPGLPQSPPDGAPLLQPIVRRAFRGPLVLNGGYTRESAERAIAEGRCDLVSFAALMIANPDLPLRFRRDAPLNPPDRATFYNGGAAGYIDYPFLDPADAAAE
jgi:N-ethylmaleimide reductase